MPKKQTPRKATRQRSSAARRSAGRRGFSVGTFGAGTLFGVVLTVALIYGPDLMPTVIGEAQANAPMSQPSQPALTYEFMNLLPNEEVVTDVTPFDVTNVQETDTSPTNSTVPAGTTRGSAREYLLQAASFRNRDEADTMRAELLLEGMKTVVNTVSNPSGGAWHRVMVGPFSSKRDMERTLTKLRSKDISALPVAHTP